MVIQRFAIPWAGALAACVLALLIPEQLSALSPWAFLATLCLLGMPHGTIDALLIFQKGCSHQAVKGTSRLMFSLTYLGAAALSAALFSAFPATGFFCFLLLTAFHWGTGDFAPEGLSALQWTAVGFSKTAAILLTIFFFHWEAVSGLMHTAFAFHLAESRPSVLLLLTVAAILCHFAALLTNRQLTHHTATDFFVLLLLAAFVSPLLTITIYYTLFHALRYYKIVDESGAHPSTLINHSHLLGVLTAVLFLIFIATFSQPGGSHFANVSLGWHLHLLAALTVPHAVFAVFLQWKGAAFLPNQSTHPAR